MAFLTSLLQGAQFIYSPHPPPCTANVPHHRCPCLPCRLFRPTCTIIRPCLLLPISSRTPQTPPLLVRHRFLHLQGRVVVSRYAGRRQRIIRRAPRLDRCCATDLQVFAPASLTQAWRRCLRRVSLGPHNRLPLHPRSCIHKRQSISRAYRNLPSILRMLLKNPGRSRSVWTLGSWAIRRTSSSSSRSSITTIRSITDTRHT